MVWNDDPRGEGGDSTPSASKSLEVLRSVLGAPTEDPLAALALLSADATTPLADPRFQEIVEIINLAIQIHGDQARTWFTRPEPELGFIHPATLLRDPGDGRKLIKQALTNHLRGRFTVGIKDQLPSAKNLPHDPPRKKRRA